MFILLAAVVFLLALLHVQLGDVNMIALGLFLLALGLLIIRGRDWPVGVPGQRGRVRDGLHAQLVALEGRQ
jgi:membrane-bound ClpP family serine protease